MQCIAKEVSKISNAKNVIVCFMIYLLCYKNSGWITNRFIFFTVFNDYVVIFGVFAGAEVLLSATFNACSAFLFCASLTSYFLFTSLIALSVKSNCGETYIARPVILSKTISRSCFLANS